MNLVTLDPKTLGLKNAISKELNMSTEDVIQIAVQRFANEVFIKQAPDDGPLTEEYRHWLQQQANLVIEGEPIFDQVLIK